MPNYFPPNPDTLIRRQPSEEIVQGALARRHANSGRFRQEAAPPREDDDIRDMLTAESMREIHRQEDLLFAAIFNPEPTPRHTVSNERATDAGADYIRARLREGSVLREVLQPQIILPPPPPVQKPRSVLHDIESVERVMTI